MAHKYKLFFQNYWAQRYKIHILKMFILGGLSGKVSPSSPVKTVACPLREQMFVLFRFWGAWYKKIVGEARDRCENNRIFYQGDVLIIFKIGGKTSNFSPILQNLSSTRNRGQWERKWSLQKRIFLYLKIEKREWAMAGQQGQRWGKESAVWDCLLPGKALHWRPSHSLVPSSLPSSFHTCSVICPTSQHLNPSQPRAVTCKTIFFKCLLTF